VSPKVAIVLVWTYTAFAAAFGLGAIASGSLLDIVGGGAMLVWVALESEESARVTRRVWSR
jgi:hypothetical protein